MNYDIYDCFTMEHFRLSQRMTLTTKIYCSRLYKRILPTSFMTQEQINMSASADIEIFLKLYLLPHCQNLHSTLATFGWKVCVNCNVARNVKRVH
jgi:hypothetical protein